MKRLEHGDIVDRYFRAQQAKRECPLVETGSECNWLLDFNGRLHDRSQRFSELFDTLYFVAIEQQFREVDLAQTPQLVVQAKYVREC